MERNDLFNELTEMKETAQAAEAKSKRTTLKNKTVLELMEHIVNLTEDMGKVACTASLKPYTNELYRRLGLMPMESILLSVIVDQCDDCNICLRDLAGHFNCHTVAVLNVQHVLDDMARRRIIRRRSTRDDGTYYRIPRDTLEALRKGHLPEEQKKEGLTVDGWLDLLGSLLGMYIHNEMNADELRQELSEMLDKNTHLDMVAKIKNLKLGFSDLVLFLAISMLFIKNSDDNVRVCDIDNFFSPRDLRGHVADLENGTHVLMQKGLVEHTCVSGQADPSGWCLTRYSKHTVYAELKLRVESGARAAMTKPDDIVLKPLYFSDPVQRQVDSLLGLLDKERMERVMARLADKGMRRGFTCLFYGAPGTGKTETAQQLAKASGRPIMLVDVPSIRSKWVGETEKNIKQVFDTYRQCVSDGGLAPILLFNEADALLNRRAEGSTDSVDKMENAMQNIILQEMEKLDGIMIATTNLTGSLDAAFERRFLYKVEFTKPTPAERWHIWKAMLPDLTDAQAHDLAARYDFSGGQIENIARKRVVNDILNDCDHLDFDAIEESCRTELISTPSTRRIGFGK